MHEMSIAVGLIEGVLHAAEEAGAEQVESVELEVGLFQQVVPEAMRTAWEAVSENTPAQGAELRLTEVPAVARCRTCGARFEPNVEYSFACPKCDQADVEIVAGRDIVLKSVTCKVKEEVETG